MKFGNWRARLGGWMRQDVLLTIGKYAAALIAIAGAASLAVALTVGPMIAEERRAREKADDRIVEHLILANRDRLDIFEMVRTPVGPEWERKYQIIRERWAQDDARLQGERR